MNAVVILRKTDEFHGCGGTVLGILKSLLCYFHEFGGNRKENLIFATPSNNVN